MSNLIVSGNGVLVLTGGESPGEDLPSVLAAGNTTDGHNIIVSTGDVITITDAPTNPTDAATKAYVDGYVDGYAVLIGDAAGGDLTGTYPNPTVANNAITDAKIRTSAALSVIGRSANSTGNVADISGSASSDAVLRISGTSLGFGTIATAGITDAAVTYAKIQNGTALSVFGRSANSTGVGAAISAVAASDSVLRESGSTIGFGTIATGGLANNAVTFAKLQTIATDSLLGRDTAGTGNVETIGLNATLSMDGSNNLQRAALTGDVTATAGSNATTIATNAVTNAKLRQGTALTVIGRSANSTGNVADIAGTNNQVLRVSGSVLGFGAVDLSTAQVTGTLPTGNQASQTVGGDLSGTTASATIAKLQATTLTVGTPGAPQDGYVLTYEQGSTSIKLKPSSGGAGSQTLAQTLVLGNSTGGTNISVNSTDQVTGAGKLNLGSTTVNHTLTGGQINSVFELSSDVTLSDGYYQILINTSVARSITLPSPVAGRKFIFFDVTGSANTNNITIIRNGSEKIGNVAASYIFTTNYGSFSLTSNGTDWMIGN